MAEVIQDIAQVGDVHRELLGAARVEAGDGGHVGEVGGARGGGQAAQEEVGGGLERGGGHSRLRAAGEHTESEEED